LAILNHCADLGSLNLRKCNGDIAVAGKG